MHGYNTDKPVDLYLLLTTKSPKRKPLGINKLNHQICELSTKDTESNPALANHLTELLAKRSEAKRSHVALFEAEKNVGGITKFPYFEGPIGRPRAVPTGMWYPISLRELPVLARTCGINSFRDSISKRGLPRELCNPLIQDDKGAYHSVDEKSIKPIVINDLFFGSKRDAELWNRYHGRPPVPSDPVSAPIANTSDAAAMQAPMETAATAAAATLASIKANNSINTSGGTKRKQPDVAPISNSTLSTTTSSRGQSKAPRKKPKVEANADSSSNSAATIQSTTTTAAMAGASLTAALRKEPDLQILAQALAAVETARRAAAAGAPPSVTPPVLARR
jgi:hypothetical protein